MQPFSDHGPARVPAFRRKDRVWARLRYRWPVVGLVLLCLVGITVPASVHIAADDYQAQIEQRQQQRAQIDTRIAQLQAQIAQLLTQEGQLRAAIAQLDRQITAQQQRVAGQQTHLDQVTAHLQAEETKLQQTKARLAQDKLALSRQVVAIYKSGENSALNNLLSAGNFNQFWQRLIDLHRVAANEGNIVALVKSEEESVQSSVNQIAADKQQQATILGQLQAEAAQLQQQYADRQAAEAQLRWVIAQSEQQVALAEQSRREVDAQIAALQAAQEEARRRAGGGSGQFLWPERGSISQGFGCTDYPFEAYAPDCPYPHRWHSGLDIAAAWGTEIHAADAGVAYTYYTGYGFGVYVIMVHGNGWSTIYGHMSSIVVGNGATVGRGQLIGYEGSTGNSSGPHLHFEIRRNNVPQDPMQHLG
jgi:murein DD-endopeptidase MepM/ murein hydrolase activator NlpD